MPGTGPTVTHNSPFSSLTVAVIITSAHYAYSQMDDQVELAWVAWLNTEMVYPRTVTHLSTNLARCRVTSLICPTTLPLRQITRGRGRVQSPWRDKASCNYTLFNSISIAIVAIASCGTMAISMLATEKL